MTTTMAQGAGLFARHREMLDRAREAIRTRAFYSAFPESPSPRVYGENAAPDGKTAFDARLGRPFALEQPSTGETVATERSPYGLELGVRYRVADVDALVDGARAARRGVGQRVRRDAHRRRARSARAHQRALVRARARGDAHDRTGVRHGVPGRRTARAGPRARGRRVRVRRDVARARARRVGEAREARAGPRSRRRTASYRAAST